MITASLILIGAAVLLITIRLIAGPSTFDRLVAADTLAVVGVAFVVVLATTAGTESYIDVALVYGVVGFLGTVTIARFLQGASK